MLQRGELLNGSSKPLVSILMPTYNSEKYVAEAIQSILKQTYTNYEFLICDDGSTDSTLKIIKKFNDDRIKVFRNEINLGELKTRNFLLRNAKGEFLAYQDADDWSSRIRIEKQVSELIGNSEVGLVGCQAVYVDQYGKFIRSSKHPVTYDEVLLSIYKINVFGGALIMFRKKIIDEVGLYRLYFDRMAFFDYDFVFRIAEKYKCYNIEDGLYYYRQIKGSASKDVNLNKSLAFYVVQYLANQRKVYGKDDLELGEVERVDSYLYKLKQPYLIDPSLIYREYSSNFMYNRLYGSAIVSSWKAVVLRPKILNNWRTFQYCIRQSLLQSVKEYFECIFYKVCSN